MPLVDTVKYLFLKQQNTHEIGMTHEILLGGDILKHSSSSNKKSSSTILK